MALGDKLPVVMGKEKAVANGVATLDSDGKLAEEQRPTTDPAPTQDSDNPVQSGGVYTALAGKADLTLSNLSNYQKALRNIGGRPNSNLLDNAYFKGGGSQQGGGQFPINQRGQTSYGAGYGMDRWVSNSCTVSIQSDGILISGSANYGNLSQIIDNPSRFAGMTVTLSALILGGSGISNGAYLNLQINGTDHVTNMSQGLVSVTVTCPSQITNMQAAFVTSPFSGYSLQVIAAKLELGSHQTLAYQDEDGAWQLFETPDYGEELDKCLFYLEIQNIPINAFIPANVWSGNSGECAFCLQYANKRITPTISFSGGGRFVPYSSSQVNLTSFFTEAATPSAAGISATLSENLTGGGAGFVDSLGQVIISAEL